MIENPLDKFRRNSSTPQHSDNTFKVQGTVPYEAYKASSKRQFRLKIRPFMKPWERITYGYLIRIVESGSRGSKIALVFTFGVVLIEGRNLQPIAEAIDTETCEFIQQFDPTRWTEPTDTNTPFIQKISIQVQS